MFDVSFPVSVDDDCLSFESALLRARLSSWKPGEDFDIVYLSQVVYFVYNFPENPPFLVSVIDESRHIKDSLVVNAGSWCRIKSSGCVAVGRSLLTDDPLAKELVTLELFCVTDEYASDGLVTLPDRGNLSYALGFGKRDGLSVDFLDVMQETPFTLVAETSDVCFGGIIEGYGECDSEVEKMSASSFSMENNFISFGLKRSRDEDEPMSKAAPASEVRATFTSRGPPFKMVVIKCSKLLHTKYAFLESNFFSSNDSSSEAKQNMIHLHQTFLEKKSIARQLSHWVGFFAGIVTISYVLYKLVRKSRDVS